MTLEELMGRYCDGDAEAFAELYRRLAPKLRAYLCRLTREAAGADDLLQLTFLKLHDARDLYVRGADPEPWLFTIAHRTFLDEYRRARRSRTELARDDSALPEIAVELDGSRIEELAPKDDGRDPRVRQVVSEALAALPANQREAILLTKYQGLTHREAARVVGTSVGAIKLRANRAFARLRSLLGAELQGPELA